MRRKNLLSIRIGLLLSVLALSVNAQIINDINEDGVVKLNANQSKYDWVPGQVLVKFKDKDRIQVNASRGMFRSCSVSRLTQVFQKYGTEEMEQLLPNENPNRALSRSRAYNGEIIQEKDLSQLYRVKLSEEHAQETMQMIEELKTIDEVEFAEPNYRLYTLVDETIAADYSGNPLANQQWYLNAYGVKELWNKPIINSNRPVIAIIDSGVDITHPDLKDNIWTNTAEAEGRDNYDNDRNGFKNDVHGWDFINNTAKIRDNNSHGTHVAGIAAAANNGLGIIGANPQALIMPITVAQSDGTGDIATLIKGINYAVNNGATVINMSIGTYANSSALRQALGKAYQSAVLVAAAGNDHKCIYVSHPHQDTPPMPCYPAAYSFVLGVEATTSSGGLASFSNYDDDGPLTSCESTIQDPDGYNYELKAPGTNILSSIPGGGYRVMQGTSMAAPLVAGSISSLMMVKQYDNQEILWGDLLHSENIAEAYNVANRPAELDITRIVLRDRNEQTDGDLKYYDVNVGETLNIYPVIRTSFGSASNIKLSIDAPSDVEILTNKTEFDYNLDGFGKMTSKNPLVIRVPNEMPNASEIIITVKATCKESEKTSTNSFTLRVANRYTLKGMLTENMTLTPDHVYYVSGKFGINEGTTLTIKPGTRLEFAKDAGIFGFGTLNIKGTPDSPIIFTSYNKNELWSGVYSHRPTGKHEYNGEIYTNADSTLFTLLPTEQTPLKLSSSYQSFYYSADQEGPSNLSFRNYFDNWQNDLTGQNDKLTDPNYLTPIILEMLRKWKSYYQQYSVQRTQEKNISAHLNIVFPSWYRYTNPKDTLTYCIIDNFTGKDTSGNSGGNDNPYYFDCIICPKKGNNGKYPYIEGARNVFANTESVLGSIDINSKHTNIVNNTINYGPYKIDKGKLEGSNFFNNFFIDTKTKKKYMLKVISTTQDTLNLDPLPYFGTTQESILRPLIYEFGNTDDYSNINKQSTFATLDLSNMPKAPSIEAHGIVWKVCVNEKDAQDEQGELLPLGVGRHKFEVYFNRPMNKAIIPKISFGVVSPFTQHTVSEEDCWNADGTIYTAYVTLDGKTQSDGINRICVQGAEDNEFFPCPIEATRFNIMIQASGSLASGFQAEEGLGCVRLNWNNENNDFEDAMGFNVYRYTLGEGGVNDTIRINEDVLDIASTSYIDDNVTPGQTYYYYYKVLSTALKEYDQSNVVVATPQTATRGDANGNGEVDVADVITTVNYMTGMTPKPFVFDAADINSDHTIDVFDVVGIIRGIINPELLVTVSTDEVATYSVNDGILYIETPVALAGLQIQVSMGGESNKEHLREAQDLDGFELASASLSDNDQLFLAYSMTGKTLAPGKHAILHIGNAQVSTMRLSNLMGSNVAAISTDETTGLDRMGKDVMTVEGVYDLSGRKLYPIANGLSRLMKGIYIVNGKKVVK